MEAVEIKAYYKYELANLYQVSTRTLYNWMNRYKAELAQLGYVKNAKILHPGIIRFLFDRLGQP